jgi:hypothetical protein
VLQDPWVQLQNGLDCTKEKPTSVPTTPEKSTLPFHPAVGRQGRWATTEKTRFLIGFHPCRTNARVLFAMESGRPVYQCNSAIVTVELLINLS